VEAHPAVWACATDDGERIVVSLLHYPGDLPALPTRARVRIPGRQFTSVVAVRGERSLAYTDAGVDVDVERLTLLVCSYA
jgi:hypothetical protein